MNQHPAVEECLSEAGAMLRSALAKLENGEPLEETGGPANERGLDDPMISDDPDDLAAAFFAQQAKKQKEEARLPVNEWAKTIFAHLDRKREDEDDDEPSSRIDTTTTPNSCRPKLADFQDDLVNELLQTFQKSFSRG